MTNNEKAKAYDEALEQAKKELATCGSMDCDAARLIFRLFPQLRESESEDERIRKRIKGLIYHNDALLDKDELLAWLEKQKYEYEVFEPVESTLEYKMGFAAEQKEQKPVEYLPKQKVFDIMNKLTNLSYSERIPIDSEEYVKIHEITSDVNSILDYPIKPVEWSEKDEKNLELVTDCVYEFYPDPVMKYKLKDWLKSLRPSWKPSEDEERLINTSISFLKDFADKGYENAVECIDWLKSKLNGNTCK